MPSLLQCALPGVLVGCEVDHVMQPSAGCVVAGGRRRIRIAPQSPFHQVLPAFQLDVVVAGGDRMADQERGHVPGALGARPKTRVLAEISMESASTVRERMEEYAVDSGVRFEAFEACSPPGLGQWRFVKTKYASNTLAAAVRSPGSVNLRDQWKFVAPDGTSTRTWVQLPYLAEEYYTQKMLAPSTVGRLWTWLCDSLRSSERPLQINGISTANGRKAQSVVSIHGVDLMSKRDKEMMVASLHSDATMSKEYWGERMKSMDRDGKLNSKKNRVWTCDIGINSGVGNSIGTDNVLVWYANTEMEAMVTFEMLTDENEIAEASRYSSARPQIPIPKANGAKYAAHRESEWRVVEKLARKFDNILLQYDPEEHSRNVDRLQPWRFYSATADRVEAVTMQAWPGVYGLNSITVNAAYVLAHEGKEQAALKDRSVADSHNYCVLERPGESPGKFEKDAPTPAVAAEKQGEAHYDPDASKGVIYSFAMGPCVGGETFFQVRHP